MVLSVAGLSVDRGGRALVHDVSFGVERGQILALMGASGAGKTTVLRAIAGLDPIASGSIAVDGVTITPGGIPRGQLRRDLYTRVGMVFQFHNLFEHLTALHNVWLAPVYVLHQARPEAERHARELLELMGVAARAGALPRELSGGEAQRVAIARALAMGQRLLLMDEPTASLDPARRADLAATIRQLAEGGCTVVVASHDEDFVGACARRIITMDAGRVIRHENR